MKVLFLSRTVCSTTLKDLKGTYLAFINCREINDLLCLKLEAGTVTEIIDPSGPVSPEEGGKFCNNYDYR